MQGEGLGELSETREAFVRPDVEHIVQHRQATLPVSGVDRLSGGVDAEHLQNVLDDILSRRGVDPIVSDNQRPAVGYDRNRGHYEALSLIG